MTTLKAIERQYATLTPDERFRLVAMAEARGDAADVRRLVDACPRKLYSMPDVAYSDRVAAMFATCEAIVWVLKSARADARVSDALLDAGRRLGDVAARMCELAYRHGYENAGGAGDPDTAWGWWHDTAERWTAGVAPELGSWRGELAAWWRAADAWALNTTGAGIGPLLSGMWAPVGPLVELVAWADAEAAAAADPDPAAVAEARATIDGLWSHLAPGA